jgi:cytochrome P450
MPVLDLLLKNPLYLLASKYCLVDATFPIARFAQDRMAESHPNQKNQSLPITESKLGSKPEMLSKFVKAKEDHPEFMTDSLVLTLAVSMAFAGYGTAAISLSAVFYYLLKTSAALEKLLDACIKEAF